MLFSHFLLFIVSLFLDFDIIYASSTPFTIALPALLLSNVKHKSFFFEIRDLWPEVPIKLGILRNKSVIFLSRLLERTAYKKSRGIVALSPGILDYVSKFSPSVPIIVAPNFAPNHLFSSLLLSDKLGSLLTKTTFRFCYRGSFGFANNVSYVLDLALALSNYPVSFEIDLIGSGSELDQLLHHEAFNLPFVRYLPPVSYNKAISLLPDYDFAFCTTNTNSVMQHNSQNKLFESMASAVILLLIILGGKLICFNNMIVVLYLLLIQSSLPLSSIRFS